MKNKPILYITTNNHFDPTWRRCWQRRFDFGGDTYASYAELQAYYIDDNLALAASHPDYKFEVESAAVLREYLRSRPEKLPALRALAQEGRFAVTGAGEHVVDANMILGESLVRNFVLGLLWVEDTLGVPARVGVRNDAFGNSAQVPQILRSCELRWATGFSYSSVRGDYWRGLDGSTVCTACLPVVAAGGGCWKYPPCRKCRGAGCPACNGRGIEPSWRAHLPGEVDQAKLGRFGAGWVRMCPEELLPNPEIRRWAARQTATYDVRFAIQEDLLPHLQDLIDRVDRPPNRALHDGVELNPNNSGTWVTRIKLKQTCRRQEYALLAAETLNVLAALAGQACPRRRIDAAWEKLLFTMFHDAITATHVDPAYDELRDVAARIDRDTAALRDRALAGLARPRRGAVSVVNPFGAAATQLVRAVVPGRAAWMKVTDDAGRAADVVSCQAAGGGKVAVEFLARDVGALSARTYRLAADRAGPPAARTRRKPVIRNGRFRIEADANGIVSVHDRRLAAEILRAGRYRVGEMILEHDEGSPWATLHPDRTRTPLADHTRLRSVEIASSHERMTFECQAPRRAGFADPNFRAVTTVTLFRRLDRIDFVTQARWNTYNHRVRVAMPLAFSGRGVYGIGYGAVRRKPYEPWFSWAGANGDWPAVNWAGVEGPRARVALLNKGLPSYCHEKARGGDVLLLSILRSCAIPTYLHEPAYYTMTDFDGMRDAGEHRFEYALAAYDRPFADSDVVADAEGYSAALPVAAGEVRLPARPGVRSPNVRLSALKWAHKGRAMVLRLVEYRGRAGEARVAVPSCVRKVARTNLLERRGRDVPIAGGCVRVRLGPWEIATLRMGL